MKKIILLIALSVSSVALAQEPAFQNEAGKTVYSTAGTAAKIAVDSKGALIGGTSSTSIGKAEDAVAGSGFTGIAALGVANTNAITLSSEGDFTPIATGLNGAVFVDVKRSHQVSDGGSILKSEDAVAASGDALVGVAAQRISNPSTLTTTANDYGTFTIDSANRLLVNDYGAPIRATLQGCSAEETGTADELILAAGGGTIRNYITGFTCSNNSAVPSRIVFKSAATAIWYGSIPALANGGTYSYSFKTPLRGGSNEAINFALTTTATATICCAVGFGSDEAS